MINWQTLNSEQQARFLMRPNAGDDANLRSSVEEIIQMVNDTGDEALKQLTARYDGVELEDFKVSASEISSAIKNLAPAVKAAIDTAHTMIMAFHRAQMQKDIVVETSPGVQCTLLIRPQQAVGLYVPGGTTPLPSTALMLGVPAMLAECPKIVLTSPPGSNGQMAPEIIYAASKCGIVSLFKVGGAQAIAAMTFGTGTIPAVDKIFGPGNRYVTEAKRQVSQIVGKVGIDMPAGPSEVLVIADKQAKPSFVASDLLAQAEHGPDSQVILISPENSLILAVEAELKTQMKGLSRRKIAAQALSNARFILASDIEQAIEISNIYAPEHLILNVKGAEQYLDQIVNAGSIFLGPWSPESVGDYASGTNHVLPTYGYARFTDSLSLKDFQKRSTVQKLTQEGLSSLSETVMTIAQSEGLDAHARSISLRLEDTAL